MLHAVIGTSLCHIDCCHLRRHSPNPLVHRLEATGQLAAVLTQIRLDALDIKSYAGTGRPKELSATQRASLTRFRNQTRYTDRFCAMSSPLILNLIPLSSCCSIAALEVCRSHLSRRLCRFR